MMRAALDALDLEGAYVAFDVAPERLADAVRGLDALGFDGANVTLPHKSSVMAHLARVDPTARLVGAVNTIARAGDALVGYNTDVEGLVGALRAQGVALHDGHAVVLGAGGAARAAAVGAASAGAHVVTVIARDVSAAKAVADAAHHAGAAVTHGYGLGSEDAASALSRATLVVQATSCGMAGGPPVDALLAGAPLSACSRGTPAMDMVYVPALTPWMHDAARAGLRVLEGAGAEMLARQGAIALRRWSGREPPLDVMRAALGL